MPNVHLPIRRMSWNILADTHKIAISNNHLVSYKDGKVRFTYKDYRQGACNKEMELTDTEFIRRFALHIPPSRFIRIRHYGILSSTLSNDVEKKRYGKKKTP